MRALAWFPSPVWLVLALVGCSETPSDSASGATGGGSGNSPMGGTGGAEAAGATSAGSGGSSGSAAATGGAGGGSAGSAGNATFGGTSGNAGSSGSPNGGNASGTAGAGGNAAGAGGNAGSGGQPVGLPNLLVFSRTAGYRHDSIPDGIRALQTLATERGWTVFATEDPTNFSDEGLTPYNVVVFLSTSGDVLDESQQAAFERFMRTSKGFAGIHSASTTEYDWPYYGELVGAYFREHPAIQPATLVVEREHPSTASLPERWMRTDEWYSFRENPRPNVEVLISLDESSYSPGTSSMQGDHPIAWYQVYEGARSFHTALGHTRESYSEELFLEHIAGGIEWAAGN